LLFNRNKAAHWYWQAHFVNKPAFLVDFAIEFQVSPACALSAHHWMHLYFLGSTTVALSSSRIDLEVVNDSSNILGCMSLFIR
jgi:hypothetical protein